MGSSGSKAAGAAARRYPLQSSIPPTPPRAVKDGSASGPAEPQVVVAESAPFTRPAESTPDPEFAQRLHSMGIVMTPQSMPRPPPDAFFYRNPNSATVAVQSPQQNQQTLATSNSQSTTLKALEARRLVEQKAEELEHGGTGALTSFIKAADLSRMLAMRERGSSLAEIEKTLRLKPGTTRAMGPPGVLRNI